MDSTDFKGLVYSPDILTQRGALAIICWPLFQLRRSTASVKEFETQTND